jgi:hypothetical protein
VVGDGAFSGYPPQWVEPSRRLSHDASPITREHVARYLGLRRPHPVQSTRERPRHRYGRFMRHMGCRTQTKTEVPRYILAVKGTLGERGTRGRLTGYDMAVREALVGRDAGGRSLRLQVFHEAMDGVPLVLEPRPAGACPPHPLHLGLQH